VTGLTAPTLVLILGFVALLALSGTFSGSETALFSLDRIQLRRFDRSASRRERLVAAVAARPERLLAGILFGNTLANVAGSSVMLAVTRRLHDRLLGLDPVSTSVVLASGIILLLGEILPKGLAVHWPTRFAPFFIPILAPILRVVAPAAGVLERVALGFLGTIGVREEPPGTGLGRRELQVLFEDIQAGKEITADEGEIAANIFDFFETRAYEIMTPRVDLVGVPVDLPREVLRDRVVEARHSRLPVYRDSLDQIVGFINTKEFLLEPGLPLDALLRPVHFVPERARLNRVLAEIQARRLNLVVVVNEYGGTAGIITKEDLVETVVGEIFDELERDQAPPLEPLEEDAWRVDGLYPLDDLAEDIAVRLPAGPVQTVAGHVAHLLGRLPRPGDLVTDGPVTYRVLSVRRHRAHRILVRVHRTPTPEEGR
jgi:putative hemolysin